MKHADARRWWRFLGWFLFLGNCGCAVWSFVLHDYFTGTLSVSVALFMAASLREADA